MAWGASLHTSTFHFAFLTRISLFFFPFAELHPGSCPLLSANRAPRRIHLAKNPSSPAIPPPLPQPESCCTPQLILPFLQEDQGDHHHQSCPFRKKENKRAFKKISKLTSQLLCAKASNGTKPTVTPHPSNSPRPL